MDKTRAQAFEQLKIICHRSEESDFVQSLL